MYTISKMIKGPCYAYDNWDNTVWGGLVNK